MFIDKTYTFFAAGIVLKKYRDAGMNVKYGDKITVPIEELSSHSNAEILIECDYCGTKFLRKYGSVLSSRKYIQKDSCEDCFPIKMIEVSMLRYGVSHHTKAPELKYKLGRKKIDEKVVRKAFEDCGLRLLSRYNLATENMEYICIKHEEMGVQQITYDRVKQGQGCPHCAIETRSENQRKYSIDEARAIFESKGCIILSDKYYNVDTPMDYICENGHTGKVTMYEFERDSYCMKCKIESLSGENHWNWKGGITSKNEKVRKSNKYWDWRNSIYERDNFTCQCCLNKGGKLNAHHIHNFSDNEELRLDINNGITLCEDCHSITRPYSFHARYTQFHNNRQQLIKYITDRRIELSISAEMHFLLL